MKVKGTVKPLHDKVFVADMEFGPQRTSTGIYIPTDNGKTQGIHPRWGRVWAIGPDQKDVTIGEWVCVEHGRWTRTVEVEEDDGSVREVRMVDSDAILMTSEERPSDIDRAE